MLRAKCARGLSFRSQLRTSPRCRCALGWDGWAQPRGSVPRSTGPAAPVFQGAKSPLRPRPGGRGRLSPASKCPRCSIRLCSKSFVSGFNPSRAALSARRSAALALPVGSFTRPHPALIMPSAPPAPPPHRSHPRGTSTACCHSRWSLSPPARSHIRFCHPA